MNGVPQRTGSLRAAGTFVRRHWPKLLSISVVLLAPCFWHSHIEAGDLGSHVYNAWLAQEIEQGRAPGLSIASQRQNVLFDWSLSRLGSLVGLRVAERACVAAAVLLFFWSAVALLGAAGGRAVWSLMPCVAMLTYGWTFHTGLFNFYVSCALAFLGLAIFWRGTRWERVAVLLLSPLILVAQPVGFVWLIGSAAVVAISERTRMRRPMLLPLAAAALLMLLHVFLASRFRVLEPDRLEYLLNGTDQFVLFGLRYDVLGGLVLAFGITCFLVDAFARRREGGFWERFGPALSLYLCAEAGILLLPDAVSLPQYGAPFSMILERVSLIAATMACCVLSRIRPRRWHAIGFGALAVVFFAFLHRDTGILSRLEDRVESRLPDVPPRGRVMETLCTDPDWRPYPVNHVVDRACIGRCYTFGNYEPATRQFRIRARPGNGIVMTSHADTEAMERGTYRVRPQDLPAFQIFQCGADVTEVCVRELSNGETNNRLGRPSCGGSASDSDSDRLAGPPRGE